MKQILILIKSVILIWIGVFILRGIFNMPDNGIMTDNHTAALVLWAMWVIVNHIHETIKSFNSKDQ